jgi:hypothetical protein
LFRRIAADIDSRRRKHPRTGGPELSPSGGFKGLPPPQSRIAGLASLYSNEYNEYGRK